MTALEGLTPGTWTYDPAHSEVGFTVRHAGISKVRGRFADVTSSLEVGETLADTALSATIKTASVDTGNPDRDTHLRSGDFFDSETYPEMTFRATALELVGDEGTIRGELTIKDVTRTVELDTEYAGAVLDPFGATRAGFSATTTISRKDFGITWNAALEAGGVMISDKVVISLDVAFVAPQG